MSITEVKIDWISTEEKYYREKAYQYLTQHLTEEVIEKFKWKRIIQSIFYRDLNASNYPSQGEAGRIVGSFINPIEYDTFDEAFDAAQRQAGVDRSQHRSSVPVSVRNGKIEFEVYMGTESLSENQRGQIYRPGQETPPQRVEFWRYTYEVIS